STGVGPQAAAEAEGREEGRQGRPQRPAGAGRAGRRRLLHFARHRREHAGPGRPADLPEAEAGLRAARPHHRRHHGRRDAAAGGHLPDLPARAAPGGPRRQRGHAAAARRAAAPREPRHRPLQGQRRADRGDADQLARLRARSLSPMPADAEDTESLAEAAAPEAGASGDAWESASGSEGPVAAERILNQDEIDSLLGFDLSDDDTAERTGIRAIINSALVSYERLPMLEIVFDRLVRLMTTSLRNFTSDNVEVSLDNISSIRFGDYLNSIPLPAILAVFRAEELDNYGLLTVESNLIYSIVDVLLGGRRGTAAMRIEGRPYTTIERSLVQRMIEVVLADMQAAFEPLSPVTFNLDRLETNPRFAAIARPANAAILVKLRIDMEDRGGRIELLLPY